MRVIRMMHPSDGRGAYTSQGSTKKIYKSLCVEGKHPPPNKDSLLMSNGLTAENVTGYLFAFTNWEQFRAWFYDDSVILACLDQGFKVYVLEVEDAIIGNAQCVYPMDANPTVIAEASFHSIRMLEHVIRKAHKE